MKQFGKKMKKRINLLISITISLALWLIFANSIIAGIYNRKSVQKIDFEEYKKYLYDDTVYFPANWGSASLTSDVVFFEGGYFEKLYINGWAFVETKQGNSNRKVALILNGEKGNYALFPSITQRVDVPTALSSSMNREMNIPSDNVGYLGYFSTLCIDYGIYDLYIFCKENDTNYGMADTKYQIVKDEDGIRLINWESTKQGSLLNVTESNRTIGNIDSISISNDNSLEMLGWQAIEGRSSKGQSVYIEFTDPVGNTIQYSTKKKVRKDVAKYYKDNDYIDSGWRAVIPESELNDGLWQIRLLCENGNDICQSKNYAIWKNGYEVNMIWLSDKIPDTIKANRSEDFVCCNFEKIAINDSGLISLWGWGLVKGEDCNEQVIYIEFTDSQGRVKQYTTNSIIRKDVADYYNNESYMQSGWNAMVPDTELEDGVYTLRMIIKNNGNIWQSQAITFSKSFGEIFVGAKR